MRNLKKVIALVLAVALTLSTFTVAFAAEATSASKLSDLGLLLNTSEEELGADLTRDIGLAMILKALGWDQDAANEKAASNPFEDVTQNWFKGYAGLAVEEGITNGVTATLFAPKDILTQKQFVAFMLRALGYETEKAWDEAADLGAAAGLVEAGNLLDAAVFTKADAADVMFAALKADLQGEGATGTLADALIAAGAFTEAQAIAAGVKEAIPAKLEVSTIKVASAKSFSVAFNKAADTAKVAFEVKRGSSLVTLTTSWNEAKTEATLTSSANLLNGEYVVKVLEDGVELKSETVKVEPQKISKIEFLTDTILRADDYYGYVTYKVTDQYGVDITNAPIANGIDWKGSVSVSSVAKTNKLLVVQGAAGVPTLTDLKYLPSVVITGYDQASATFISQSFKVSDKVSGIETLTITGIVDKDGKAATLVAGSAEKYYLTYEAVDSFGNKVTDYNTLNNPNVFKIFSSNATVANVQVVKDPKNNVDGVLEVTLGAASAVTFDMPVVFTGITYTSGKNVTFNTTVLKAAAVKTFTIYAPNVEVSKDETVAIPYVAYDQNGNQITSFDQLNGKVNVTLNGASVTCTRGADGKAEFKANFTTIGINYLTATVATTGSYSTTTVNVRNTAIPTSVARVDSADYKAAMVKGAKQEITVEVNDQYDRTIGLDVSNVVATKTYTVVATSDNAAAVAVSQPNGHLGSDIELTAGTTPGVATITFTLRNTTDGEDVDTSTITVSNVEKKDIVAYEIEPIKTVYANDQSNAALQSYTQDIDVIGKLIGGTKVALATADVLNITSSSAVFTVAGTKVTADSTKMGATDTEATAKVTATVLASSGLATVTADIKASKAAPVITELNISVALADKQAGDVSISGDTITVKAAELATAKALFFYKADGTVNGAAASKLLIKAKNNYNNNGAKLPSYVNFTERTTNGRAITVDANGVLTSNAAAGDEFLMTVVSDNGLSITKIVKVIAD